MTNAQLNGHFEDCTCNECLPFELIESTLDVFYWSKEWEDLNVIIKE